jgi:hypothetical protein
MKKTKKNLARSLHRDLGYFFIGITLIYAITGFVLSVRGLGWFKEEYIFKTMLTQNIQIENFKEKLIIEAKAGKLDEIYSIETAKTVERNINRMGFIDKTGDTLLFKYKERLIINYDQISGQTNVYYKAYPKYLQLFISAHLATNNYVWYYLAMIYSVVLAFFAISAIFIVKGKYGFKRRGLALCLAGIILVLIFIYFSFYSS